MKQVIRTKLFPKAITANACLVLTLSCPLSQLVSAETAVSDNPNILFIYLDDLGYGDLSCYNP